VTADSDSPTARTPLGDYLRHEWLPRKGPAYASGSRRHRTWAVATLCESRLVDRPIGELTTLEIERYFAERAGTPFPQRGQLPARGSLKALFSTLNACLGEAARYGIIAENPCARVRLPPDRSEAQSIWTAEQVQQFLKFTARSRHHTLWRVLFATGMRRGEALGLTWRSLDLERGRIHITRAMLADSRRGHVMYGPPKNRTSMRTIGIDAGTRDAPPSPTPSDAMSVSAACRPSPSTAPATRTCRTCSPPGNPSPTWPHAPATRPHPSPCGPTPMSSPGTTSARSPERHASSTCEVLH